MDFEEFKEQFAEDVKNDLEGKGIDASVKINSVEKMNETYDALTVTPEGSNVGVNLNMNKFFEAYDSGDVDYDQVVDKAVKEKLLWLNMKFLRLKAIKWILIETNFCK